MTQAGDRQHGITVIDGGCPCMFNPTADPGHKAMRFVFTLTGSVPRRVLRHGLHDCHHQVIPPAYRDVRPHEHQSRQGRRRPVQALGRSRWPCCQRAPAGCGPCLAGCCALTCRGGGPALARRLANTRCGCPLASYDELDRPGTLRRHQVTDPGARNQRAWMWKLGATAEGRTR